MKNRLPILISLLLISLVSGCTKKSSDESGTSFRKDEVPLQNTSSKESDYDFKESKSSFGAIQVYTIKTEALKKLTEKLKNARLRPLNLESAYGVTAYHIEGYEIPRTVLIVPKIVFRSSINGRRPILKDEGSGRASLQTQFALVDGITDVISSGMGARSLSSGFTIKNPSAFLSELKDILGGVPNFLANVQCPESVQIKDSSQGAFKIQLNTPLKSCPTNVFLPARVSFYKTEYDQFREHFLAQGELSVETAFSFGTPVTLAFAKFLLQKSVAKSGLAVTFPEVSKWHSSDELITGLQNFIEDMQKSFGQCIPQESFAQLKDQLVENFFETKIQPDCPSGLAICYKRNTQVDSSGVLDIAIKREDFLGSRVKYYSNALLSDTLSEKAPVLLKQSNLDPVKEPAPGTINNALRTVQEGDWIEFTVAKLRQTSYEFENPIVQNISNMVCLSPFKSCLAGNWKCTNPNSEDFNCRQECTGGWDRVCVRGEACMGCAEWGQRCRSYSQICDQRHICDRLTAPTLPLLPYRMDKDSPNAPDFAWECTNQTDNQCDPDRWQDQWQRISKFSTPKVSESLRERIPTYDDINTVISGLTFKFSNGSTCPLSLLTPRILSPTRVVFQIVNRSGCTIFRAQDRKSYQGPNLSIINAIAFKSEFRCGQLWEDFAGNRRYSCLASDGKLIELDSSVDRDAHLPSAAKPGIWIPYFPRTEVEAQLRFVGGYFETEPEGKINEK